MKRSLILAGGGLKVAFQAGVLQVWLDEAGLTFDHVDGTSGGVFNLAMYCQGMSGTQIADAWRRTRPLEGVDVDPVRLLRGDGLLTLDAYRDTVFPAWGLDWTAIRSSPAEATFNVCNVDRYALDVREPADMTEDLLLACVSLPMWFPPVVLDGTTYVDAVYLTDANLEEALRRGADEIWVIWTVSERGEWRGGFVNHYFQTIEIAANGNFRRIVRRIEDNNAAIASGAAGEFGRQVALRILRAEVPVHYLVNVDPDRLHAAVELGVAQARAWCRGAGIPLPRRTEPPPRRAAPNTVTFSEVMRGFVALGETDPEPGSRVGRDRDTQLTVKLTISVDDVDRFVTSPRTAARVGGQVCCPALGGDMEVIDGEFNLFVLAPGKPSANGSAGTDPRRRRMYYRLPFVGPGGKPMTLLGEKIIEDDPGADLWTDTTTLFTRVARGHIRSGGWVETGGTDDAGDAGEAGEAGAATPADGAPGIQIIAAGIITIRLLDFLHQLTTFRAGGPPAGRAQALRRFGTLFLGRLWDVYARDILPHGGQPR